MRDSQSGPAAVTFSGAPSNRGGQLSRDAVAWLITKHTAIAANRCSSIGAKNVTAHVLRHTNAMTMLQAGYR